jgi:hypothetical protein
MQVFQNTLQHVNFLQPESIVAPIIIALIILIVCALIAVNMILLLCAAWVVVTCKNKRYYREAAVA